jgi:hypothetical protein
MMKIDAFKCAYTGKIYESEGEARRSEFCAMMRKVPGHLPAPASSHGWSVTEWFDWLASELVGGVYPSTFPALMEAMIYFQEHRTIIENRR